MSIALWLEVLKPPIVTDQTNPSSGIGGYQSNQKDKKVLTIFGLGHRVNYLSGLVTDTTVDHPLFIFARRRNLRLLAYRSLHLRQCRMQVNLHLILKDQGLLGIVFHRFFFKRRRPFLAFSYACSSRLPLRVCLGRWMENPSRCSSLRN